MIPPLSLGIIAVSAAVIAYLSIALVFGSIVGAYLKSKTASKHFTAEATASSIPAVNQEHNSVLQINRVARPENDLVARL